MNTDDYINNKLHPALFTKAHFGYDVQKAQIDEAPMSASGRRAAMAGLDAAYRAAKNECQRLYGMEEARLRRQFECDAETYYGFSHLSEQARQAIHAKAWEEGHAYGYSEVANQYPDLVEFAEKILG